MTTKDGYRILTRAPKETEFKLRKWPGATGSDLATMLQRLERERRLAAAGWEFRLERRLVITITGDWGEVEE
jgi:hypothetical protein